MDRNYWTKGTVWGRRVSRRSALRGGVIGAAGLGAAILAACGGNSSKNNATKAGTTTNTGGASGAANASPGASARAAAATAPAAPIKRGGSLKYSGAELFTSLDPTYSGSYMDLFMSFEPLLGLNQQGEPQANDASLATAYEQIDPTTTVFHLRKGVKFHDGTPFNGQSVKDNITRYKTGATSPKTQQDAEIELARQAETAYRRLVTDWQQTPKKGADATPGRASSGRQSGKQRGRASVPDPAL